MSPIDFKALHYPFPPSDLSWKVGSVRTNPDGTHKANLMTYIDARAVMDRLDEVCGPQNWQDSYEASPGGGIMCTISVKCGDEWVAKCDSAENTNYEAVKGGISSAFKRAAVKWGVGRYLYSLDAAWYPVRSGWANGKGVDVSTGRGSDRKHVGWIPYPKLPTWALPAPPQRQRAPEAPPPPQAEQRPQEAPEAPQKPTEPARVDYRAETPEQKAERQKNHDRDWSGDRPWFMASLTEVGLGYPDVREYCVLEGWGSPSCWPRADRRRLIADLKSANSELLAYIERYITLRAHSGQFPV